MKSPRSKYDKFRKRKDGLVVLTGFVFIAFLLAGLSCRSVAWQTMEKSATKPATQPFERIGELEGAGKFARSPFSADGNQFITHKDDCVRVWNPRTLEPITHPLRHPGMEFYHLAAEGNTVLTASNKEVRLWDVASCKLLSTTVVSRAGIKFVEVSPDASHFVTVEDIHATTVQLWRAGHAHPVQSFRVNDFVNSAEFDPKGRWVVTHEYLTPYQVWSVETGQQICAPIDTEDEYSTPYRGQFDPAGRRFVLPSQAGFKVYDLPSGNLSFEVNNLFDFIYTATVQFSRDGKQVILTTTKHLDPASARIYNATTGKLEHEIGDHVGICEISADGRWALCSPFVLTTTAADMPELWDLSTNSKVQTFDAPGRLEAHLSPNGSVILIELASGVTQVWKMRR